MKSFKKKIQNEISQLLDSEGYPTKEVLKDDEIDHLPEPVKKWLNISGAVGRTKISSVFLRQKFLMKLKPKQKKWYRAEAQQVFTISNPAFIWKVHLKIAPFVAVLGRDKFTEGKGEMQMKLNGFINLGNKTGIRMDEGTLQRYLGEIVWFPSASISPYIEWTGIDSRSAKAVMTWKETSGSGTFFFDEEGRFEKFIAQRYFGNTTNSKRTEWIITAQEHTQRNGVTIPSKLEAMWILDSGPWTWCNIEIIEVRYNSRLIKF